MVKILVVDDSQLAISILRDTLEGAGHVVTTAMNVAEAMNALRKETPDLIFMDIQMPGADGHQATKLIKMHKGLAEIPIIIFSTLKSAKSYELSGKVGAVVHLSKDASSEKILYTVNEVLEIAAKNESEKDAK
ncbi:MAG: response regulator [Deltaproteobacteria bacterium]|nr:response regulator [Deltaproteobacteria bacterium]